MKDCTKAEFSVISVILKSTKREEFENFLEASKMREMKHSMLTDNRKALFMNHNPEGKMLSVLLW